MSTLLGIDLGTSSVKLLLRHPDGRTEKSRAAYEEISPAGWLKALARAAKQLDLSCVDAVGLTSQVGTYIIDDKHVLSWNDPMGLRELQDIKKRFSGEEFLMHIGMDHPDMVSYPLPRLLYIADSFPGFRSVCMPKELLTENLTGSRISDMYSWRGFADLENCRYSPFFSDYLSKQHMDTSALPQLVRPTDLAGHVTHDAASTYGLREGTPVYTGCNDFFAALLGSGIHKSGDMFDITGTSEHLGAIADDILDESGVISGRYFNGFVRYGVTASSGPSIDYGRKMHNGSIGLSAEDRLRAPIFLPYVNGERCPVCDPMARGVMFGISAGCTDVQMAYSVMEGVAFNLKQIHEKLQSPHFPIIACGGAAQNAEFNQLKSDILGERILAIDEPDASALGAALIAGVGCGEFAGLTDVPKPAVIAEFTPTGEFDYNKRYSIYKQLYPALKEQFHEFGRITI